MKGEGMGFKGPETESSSNEMNFIGKGTYVEGQIVAEGNLRISGRVKGKVVTKDLLTVSPSGEIDGEVEAKDAVVGGTIKGKIKVMQKLELEAKAKVHGDIDTRVLIIDEGAIFHGNSVMGEKKPEIGVPIQKNEFKK